MDTTSLLSGRTSRAGVKVKSKKSFFLPCTNHLTQHSPYLLACLFPFHKYH
ncbi:hypothetical protein KsCSTR_22970 [Candidatus Kuenenia stuttgartiensis]|uniref:Uncharacterized protein n=1 Tax=Kuenenia stuttgartiensis TaxID=174633 RepID=Q1Q3H9_KUEST|nr:hypothetical protein KsCSTR_22970 [Candidatus Kuenenia stuttgartiensis]CAJ74567.1 unknown protein [Candidatus Kuenenia stuttgartiensis]